MLVQTLGWARSQENRHIMRRNCFFPAIFLAFAAIWMTPVQSAEMTLTSAINIAGQQRMLTQRMVKAYIQVGIHVLDKLARKQLTESIALFEIQLTHLKAYVSSDEQLGVIAHVEKTWGPFKAIAVGASDREGAQKLSLLGEELLFLSNRLVQQLQNISRKPFARLVNISGRQRMLSQRLAKLYFLRNWGGADTANHEAVEIAKNEFSGALMALQAAPENTHAIRDRLEAVAVQWTWFKSALRIKGSESYPLIIAESSERILKSMDKITKMYEGLSTN